MRTIAVLFAAVALAACGQSTDTAESLPATDQPAPAPAAAPAETAPGESASGRLQEVLDAQPAEHKARYEHRHPGETLEFFGIEPGMTVIEALPGTGWYSRILVPYLGSDGRLLGANYAQDMWPLFGFFGEDFIESMKTWTTDWPQQAEDWGGDEGARVEAFEFGRMPESLAGQADAVLFIRALHNLARFEEEGDYLTTALADAHRALRPGGIVGVVQHEARPETADEWAGGQNGYLKKQFVIDRFTAAGFVLDDESDVNENADDRPTEADVVWRLPPSYATAGDDQDVRIEMDAIGESNRMTLRFRKPE